MFYLGRLWAIAALTAFVAAAPARLESRDVSSELLADLTLFAEYSAAAYCASNINSTGTKVTCPAGNCPKVQSATTATLDEFHESCSFGDVAGFLAVDSTNQLLVLSFRGSRSLSTWIANLDFGLTSASSICDGCEAHNGFLESWETVADTVTAQVQSATAKYPGYTLVFTGHSFGAAIATLGAAAMRKTGYSIELYTYGSPRVGNKALATFIAAQSPNYRVTHTDDIVPKLPPRLLGFSHPSPEYWITSDNTATVTTSSINVITEMDSSAGNAGAAGVSISAHNYYIVYIAECE